MFGAPDPQCCAYGERKAPNVSRLEIQVVNVGALVDALVDALVGALVGARSW